MIRSKKERSGIYEQEKFVACGFVGSYHQPDR